MFANVRSTTYVLMAILVAFSGLEAVVAVQQYVFLQGQKELALIRREQDESFLIVMKAVGGESNLELDKALALRKVIIEGMGSTDTAMIRQLEVRAIAGVIGWCVVFAISGVTLFLNRRRQV
jgi:hypothetical protein